MKKRGVAPIITTVLLILLVLVLVVGIWNFYFNFLKDKAADITTEGLLVDGELEYYLPNEFAIIKVKRNGGEGNVIGLKIMFTEASGQTYVYETADYPKVFEMKRYLIFKGDLKPVPGATWNFGEVKSISLYYMIDKEKVTPEVDKEIVKPEKISPLFGEKCLYPDTDNDGFGTGTPSTCTLSDIAITGMTPINGDCNDDLGLGGNLINPGASETCDNEDQDCDGMEDEGTLPPCPRQYSVTEVNIGTYWNDDDCSTGDWTEIDLIEFIANRYKLEFNLPSDKFDFYNGYFNVNSIYICKTGWIRLDDNSCLSGMPTLTYFRDGNHKIISPYRVNGASTIAHVYYCKKDDKISIRWIDNQYFMAKAILYFNGDIKFSYYKGGTQDAQNSQVGLSVGNGQNYNQTIPILTKVQKDYSYRNI
ncbi:MAG: putative metal-binding motif-containing protein [Candidatus Pacearchaeota archaeon]|jgi:flagellin-like protein